MNLCQSKVSATLREAAAYLDRHGWIQGCYYDTSSLVFTPAACMVGAIGVVCYGGPVDAPALNYDDPGYPDFDAAMVFLEFVLIAMHDSVCTAYDFNDAKRRTVEEVVAALRFAADQWDQAFGGAR